MTSEMPPLWLFWLFGLIFVFQFGRFGVLVVSDNPPARRGLNMFTFLVAMPLVLTILKPEAVPQLGHLILWTRDHIIVIYAAVSIAGEFLLHRARTDAKPSARRIRAIADAIRANSRCVSSSAGDLVLRFPVAWRRKQEDGKALNYWSISPVDLGCGIDISVVYGRRTRDPADITGQLAKNIEEAAGEARRTITSRNTIRIANKVDGVDVLASEEDGTVHRSINFYVNGTEYLIVVRAKKTEVFANAGPVLDAWLESLSFQEGI